jgi:Xaa-Pro aminopeptidase
MMRLANEVACLGYAAAREVMIPGLKDSEVSAAVEALIYGRGVGYRGLRRARGFCHALSGPNSAMGENPYFISSPRELRLGDVVLVELDTFADGYFSDLSRTLCVGQPDSRAQEIWGIVNEALETMLTAIEPGVQACELNRLARDVVTHHGYPNGFVHHAGHGIGLQFHEPPTLHPCSDEVLAEGMVLSLEPHCYITGWGGVRVEENVVVTRDGYHLLSVYPRGL